MNGDANDGFGVKREHIKVTTHDGHPALEIEDSILMLRTEFAGTPPENAEVDHFDGYPFFVVDFHEDRFDHFVEITPEFVSDNSPVGDADER